MCTGVEIALIASAGISAGSAIASGEQQKDMANYQAKQAQADARTAQDAAAIEGDKIREHSKRVASAARAAMAASGLSLESETANAINADIIKRGEKDALIGNDDGADMASRLRAQAQGLKIAGRSAQTAGYANAASSALSSYSASGGGWYGGRAANAPTKAGQRTQMSR